MKPTENNTAYDRALKRVEEIKKFYGHVKVYIIINVLLLLITADFVTILDGNTLKNISFEKWLHWNTYGTAAVWGIGLLAHGLYAFRYKFTFLKKWEARKIEQLMQKEDEQQSHGI